MFFGLDLGEDVPLLRPGVGGGVSTPWSCDPQGPLLSFPCFFSSHSLAPAFHIHPVVLRWRAVMTGGGGVIVVESEASNHPREECMTLFGGPNRDFRGSKRANNVLSAIKPPMLRWWGSSSTLGRGGRRGCRSNTDMTEPAATASLCHTEDAELPEPRRGGVGG